MKVEDSSLQPPDACFFVRQVTILGLGMLQPIHIKLGNLLPLTSQDTEVETVRSLTLTVHQRVMGR
jgi:hypothetical protein